MDTAILKNIGLKQTKPRLSVLEALHNAESPMTAEQIYRALPDNSLSLSTVYRTLELFTEKGVTAKSNILDSGVFYYELTADQHRHCAICLSCKQMRYVQLCPVHELHIDHFTVTGHKLEIYGYCDQCTKMLRDQKEK